VYKNHGETCNFVKWEAFLRYKELSQGQASQACLATRVVFSAKASEIHQKFAKITGCV
jgi:hypothetical protein